MRFLNMNYNTLSKSALMILFVLIIISGATTASGKMAGSVMSQNESFKSKSYYPTFSWDVTPQYFMFGQMKGLLTPEQVDFISKRTNFLCIEKSHGIDEVDYAEIGAKHEIKAFKKANRKTKGLFYFNSAYAYSFTSYTQQFKHSKIKYFEDYKDFVISDPRTGELENRNRVLFFDVLNPDFRKWWVDTVIKGIEASGADGAFIDQMHGFSWLRQENSREVIKAMGEMMADLKRRMPADKILLGNNASKHTAPQVYPHVDAVMFEHYNSKLLTKENLLSEWGEMRTIAEDGKISIFRIGIEYDVGAAKELYSNGKMNRNNELFTKVSKKLLEYHLACYLIGAQPYSYFQYGWGWRLSSGSLVDFPELNRPLGPPKGEFKRVSPKRWAFTREFEHASVWVDTEKRKAKIIWK